MNTVEALDANPNKQALLSFKSTVSDPQNALSDWNSSSSHCTWFGVTCTSNRTSVQSLHLPGVGLSGIIPPHLFNLTSLQVLDLSNNSFQGQIPAGLSHCYNLREINLRRNQLVGPLPSQLGHLSRLKFMDVYANNLSGAIPPTFGNLTSLTHLNLGRNNFRDEIPKELGNLHNLVLLRLSENQLSGQIPNSLYNISSLSFLSLTQNHLVGKLPTDMGLALPNLRQLLLAENSFEGLIPSSLNNASEIQFLDLSSNLFQGSIPFLGNMNKLIMLNLGVNNLSSTTELNLQVFDSLTNCTLLESLILNSNKLAGNLPSSVANLSAHLQHFCIESNLFTGKLPRGIDKFQSLISLTLQQNLFTGELPNSIGRLNKLQRIFVHENMFSGEIPNVFGNLTQLYMLTLGYNQFSGRIPVSIGECQQLNTLGLSWNRLNGSIPIEIFSLSGLSKLWLEKNSLQGSLPIEVGSLKQLSLLNVSDNQLSGNITETIGNCLSLQTLSMARNGIMGSIPDKVGKLVALKSLDLSSNNLSGPIPEYLGSLKDLQSLNLSFNDLEGKVPRSGVFMNLSWDSLQGNDMLCGSDQEVAGKLRLHTCSTKKKQSKHFGLTISIAVVGFTLLMCVIFYFIWALVSRRRKKKGTKESFFSRPFKGFPEKMSYFEIRLATNSFAAENLIGEGGFGSVYKGVLRTGEDGAGTTLAIKVLDLQQSKASQSFYAECEALRNIRHRNLVKVITSCSSIDHTGGEFKALVMEFMSNGSLYNWLNPEDSQSRSSLTLIQRLNIAIDVASAMDYLHHDCDPPIVHCDLKPGNVLLDDDMAAHVGDFGLARFLSQNPSQSESSTIGLKGSIGYIAPEYGLGGKASTNGDVYSFGILLLEIFTARKPTDEIFQQGLNQKKYALAVQANQVSEIVDPGIFSHTNSSELSPFISSSACSNHSSTSSTISVGRNKNEECLAAIIRVGLCCADHSPSDRLTIRETLTKLQEIRKFLLEL
ncbi:hypothetical protein VitviT2T_028026 [Vitis vinifera]|uniref:Protein kinase domain-containing protein n=2 Tax=Vitis vinifera TaxID=29760 RepID=A0ABY9DTR5_VITVI|nr:hypothetical protein VitviT2T_028026 [Vitis vinifera]